MAEQLIDECRIQSNGLQAYVQDMQPGWNLGNSLDSVGADETAWGNPCITKALIGGLSFVKTVISASVAKTLEPDEAGSGMGMLNFACFLAEGIGIASVGGLLTKPWLDSPLIATVTSQAAALYSNIMLIFIALATLGGLLFVLSFKRNRP